jgi:ketosteroid isomerase-like protein
MRGRWALGLAAVMVLTFAALRPHMPERSTSIVSPRSVAAEDPSSEEQLRSLVRSWDSAYIRQDTKTLSFILADDYEMIDAAGQFVSRTDYIINAASAAAYLPEGESGTSTGLLVRLYGDSAVVTGRSRTKGMRRNHRSTDDEEVVFTDLFVKSGDQWRAVATHATRVVR